VDDASSNAWQVRLLLEAASAGLCGRSSIVDVRIRPRKNDLTVPIPNVIAIKPAHLFPGEPENAIECDQETDIICRVAGPTGFPVGPGPNSACAVD
jgi:hypothetical protein